MKKSWLYIIVVLLFLSCRYDKKTEPDPYSYTDLPEVNLAILKFPDSVYLDKVVACQHRYSINKYVNNDSTSLFLYQTSLWEELISFAHQKMALEGSSPYIPLTDGYYLIDWKWMEFYPLCSHLTFNTYEDEFLWVMKTHRAYSFFTDKAWKDLTNIADTFDISQCSANLEGVQVMSVPFRKLDLLYNENKHNAGRIFYTDEYSIYWVRRQYDKYDKTESGEGSSYLALIHQYDSMQSVNQQRLIEIINNGEIEKIAWK